MSSPPKIKPSLNHIFDPLEAVSISLLPPFPLVTTVLLHFIYFWGRNKNGDSVASVPLYQKQKKQKSFLKNHRRLLLLTSH